ncbi:MAG: thermonuclease family protein [Myxococcota bacterium]|nr:thermonuclease family protein [Myxococcota bacterium]MEC9391028.1 thermonuclease family protein [Myxococcota bacterium]
MIAALVGAGLLSCVADPPTEAVNVDTGVTPDTITETGEPPDPVDEIDASALPQGAAPCRAPVLGTVADVTDGDTIKVETGRGVERVRLIGIDTPEVDHSGPNDECFGEESKAYMTAMLDGKRIWLTFDAECEDRFGRTLAYVHRGTDENPFVQRLMLQGGWAESYAVQPNVSFRETFEADQSQARSRGDGIWGSCR